MASRQRQSQSKDQESRKVRPATTPEARENQLVSRAFDLAEQQLMAGTASSQVITHFLKLGSSREKLEQERLAKENELLEAKREAMAATARIEELYADAISAMRTYAGADPLVLEESFDD